MKGRDLPSPGTPGKGQVGRAVADGAQGSDHEEAREREALSGDGPLARAASACRCDLKRAASGVGGSAAAPMRKLILLAIVLALAGARTVLALDVAAVGKLALGESDEKIEAISALVAEADPRSVPILEALAAGDLQTAGKRC